MGVWPAKAECGITVLCCCSAGRGGLQASDLPPGIPPVGDVPHAWLFPRVAAVGHHGGAGTTAAGLCAGRPTQVTAFFGDQPYFGTRVHAVGAGPKPLLRGQLDAARLASSIAQLVGNPRYAERAAQLGAELSRERGVQRAADVIERHFARQ